MSVRLILLCLPFPLLFILDAHLVVENMYLGHAIVMTFLIVYSLMFNDPTKDNKNESH